jgi:N utilization substance protein A
VYLDSDQVSLAIGKKGVNIKLAQELTGYSIDVFRDAKEELDYDIDLTEFADEIEPWIIEELKKIGCDTALSVLELSDEELVRRTDLEDVTVKELRAILEAEFKDEEQG